ncbi:MAG: agmatine deiminase family protein, partial [Prevotella sp.]|nr:agmatine deiminase family protein [Prevotella sp.]
MENFRLPAEWEAQWGVMLTWPHEDTDWKPYLAEITATYVEMAREIVRREWLLIVVPRAEIVPEEVRKMERVVIFECPTDDTWARDHGPVVLKAKTHPQPLPTGGEMGDILPEEYPKKRLWLDFRFNGWGEKFPADNDNRIVERLDERIRMKDEGIRKNVNYQLSIVNCQLSIINYQLERHQDFVLEGGSIESDGRGTIFTTSQCLLAPNRNQPLTQAEIEAELKRRLRAERVVWLDHGNLVGDDTDGHIDTIV